MATRPIFVPTSHEPPYVREVEITFQWFPGFAKSQAQKSIAAMHDAAGQQGLAPVLEISSKSVEPLGTALSAFHLLLRPAERPPLSVECAFQGSKVFEHGGPYTDLYDATSRDAKTDARLRDSGALIAFRWQGHDFPLEPRTAFYDWLYLTALTHNPEFADTLPQYCAFSDIAFNPDRSLNCQARSAALFVALQSQFDVGQLVADWKSYQGVIMPGNTAPVASI